MYPMIWHIFQRLKRFGRTSLQGRFLLRVLLPPFLILLVVSLVGYFQLSGAVRNSAIDTLKKAAATTGAKLEREFALRRTVLRNTGGELFSIKKEYQSKRQ